MSSNSNNRQPASGGTKTSQSPEAVPKSIGNFTLMLLVIVDLVVAVMMVVEFAGFIVNPDPALEAVPMYVVLTLTTGAALLMFFMALNASFFPLLTAQRARDVRLVMWTMGATGILTGALAVGGAVQGIVMRLFIGALAFVFIRVQESRLDRARRRGPSEPVVPPADQKRMPPPKARQRRGGRRH
jgi:hypothetical protein